jgi:gamma-glutamylcyclotransferase
MIGFSLYGIGNWFGSRFGVKSLIYIYNRIYNKLISDKLSGKFIYFDLSEDQGKRFNNHLIQSYRNASQNIYLSGRGFREVPANSPVRAEIEEYMNSVDDALHRNIIIVRIQTSKNISKRFSERLRELLRKYPENFELYMDTRDPPIVNVAVIDAGLSNAEVQLLIEAERFSGSASYYGAVSAISILRSKELAIGVRDDLLARARILKENGKRVFLKDFDSTFFTEYYFAYGSNILSKKIKSRCSSAQKISNGILYDWNWSFNVQADHLNGSTAGIFEAKGYKVEGVLYKMNPEDIDTISSIEQGGYKPRIVNIKTKDATFDATTFIPVRMLSKNYMHPPPDYLEEMLEGARENGLEDLEQRLLKYQHSTNRQPDL